MSEELTRMPEWERCLRLALIATESGTQGPLAAKGHVVVSRSDLAAALEEVRIVEELVRDADSHVSWCRHRHKDVPIGGGENVGRNLRELDDWLYMARRWLDTRPRPKTPADTPDGAA